MNFNRGDKVIKYKPWSTDRYCKYGGSEREVPIGTKGEVIGTEVHNALKVKFFNPDTNKYYVWSVGASEIRSRSTLKSLLEDI